MENSAEKKYKILITVAIYREGILSYKSELLVPNLYNRRTEARGHIKKEISERLLHSNFFRSPRLDYDLVRYTEEATCNTFLRYSIMDVSKEFQTIESAG
ncbi:hypothetical protein [Leptospira sp. GIMC2001]|uniref:hypothetical protein n=1 Tax=Leptospira sp. GIMC2001 TaxID=1513297 RepID=UPI00234AACFB|nr:hypothetical protein [Leptospira sp. GIMC2001]WCL48205.1 hypothetical protein O4O04_12905 [Leptospira sp. GIMC2001]